MTDQIHGCSACDCATPSPHHIHPDICKCGHAMLAHHGKNTIHINLWKVWTSEKGKVFSTLDEASAYRSEYEKKTGIIVAVTAIEKGK